jgi:hypothetical protein
MKSWWFLACVLASCLFALAAGCGADNPLGRKAISGNVTLDGAPIANGSVNFQPMQSGGVSSGAVITAGKYSIVAEQGLPTGKYRVVINATDAAAGQLPAGAMPGDDVPEAKELVPPEWNEKSEHMIDVTDKSAQEFNFDISTKK